VVRPRAEILFWVLFAACNGAGSAVSPPAARTAAAPPSVAETVRPLAPPNSAPAAAPSAAGSARAPREAASSAAPVEAANGVPSDMLPVPGGEFTMGADGAGERDEQPRHKVSIGGFLLDKVEVTNADYLECVKAGPCKPYRDDVAKSMKAGPEQPFRGPRKPVVGVSWFDAKAYCGFRGKRLPTEAEWEKAARSGDGRTYVWGEQTPDPKRHGCFAGCNGATADIGSFPDGKGPYGHLDLAGNVWEWTEDLYDPMAYTRPGATRGVPGSCEEILKSLDYLRQNKLEGYTGTNPIPTECERVLRGGAFNYPPKGLRASNRVHHPGGWRLLVAGFRCAKDA
jgi:formylglycine-generating enzyme required for sulfatase activity